MSTNKEPSPENKKRFDDLIKKQFGSKENMSVKDKLIFSMIVIVSMVVGAILFAPTVILPIVFILFIPYALWYTWTKL